MAALSLVKLDGVNEMMEAIGELRVTILDSSGSWPSKAYGASEAGRAEYILDRESRKYQSQGFAANTDLSRFFAFNLTGSPFTQLDLSASPNAALRILHVRGAGPQHAIEFSLRNGVLWNNSQNTDVLTSIGTTVTTPSGALIGVFLDVVRLFDFDDLDPRLKHAIVDEAKLVYQRRIKQNPQMDQYLMLEAAKSSMQTAKPSVKRDSPPINQMPTFMPQQQGSQQQQGQ